MAVEAAGSASLHTAKRALIRTMCDIRRVFTYNTQRAMVLRGSPEQMAMAEWLFDRVDQGAGSKLSGEFRVPNAPDDVLKVYYLTATLPIEDFQSKAVKIRNVTQIWRVLLTMLGECWRWRGTTDQLARAEKMMEGGF